MKHNRPIQTDAQNLGDVGETTVQLILKKFKWTADIIKSDFGEDIDSNIFIDNARTNYHLRCQVKSTSKDSQYIKILKNGNYSVSIASTTLKAWLSSYFPVFLIIYNEETDLCHWSTPVEQILKTPSKLEKENPSIQVSINNIFDQSSRELILDKVLNFYSKIQRLEESRIECNAVPILMPDYRIIPFHQYSNFLKKDDNLSAEISGDYMELLPSWMSVLKRIDPTDVLTSIKLASQKTEIDLFIKSFKIKLDTFQSNKKDNEWFSFIISPIKIQSANSSWSNEITYWNSFSKINNKLINDLEFCFEIPQGFLRQISRRARSWDYLHHINPKKDIALQLFGKYQSTPTIKKIEEIHHQNIHGQYILWDCKKNEINQIEKTLAKYELAQGVIKDFGDKVLLVIHTYMFNPFIGMYNVPMDWDSFENGNVRNTLIKNRIFELIPGDEHKGETPKVLLDLLAKYSNREITNVKITEMEYIPGFPLKLNERQIMVSRFQMVSDEKINLIERKMNKVEKLRLKDYQIELSLIDDLMWKESIYELCMSWTPVLEKSSSESYLENEKSILKMFDTILPTSMSISSELKNSHEILHLAGEIGFEKNDG